MIDFPSSPTLNQIYTVGLRSWLFNGEGWQRVPQALQTSVGFTQLDQMVDLTFSMLPDTVPVAFTQLTYVP